MFSKFALAFLSCLVVSTARAIDFKVPWLSGPVVDELGVLSSSQRQQLEGQIRSFHEKGIAQVQVFVTQSLQDLPIEKASIDIVDQWKLGSAEKDNGVLFLIAPRERKVRIEVGQGLEGILPDIYTKRINEDIVLPHFKRGDLAEGILVGTQAILSVLSRENVGELEKYQPERSGSRGLQLPIWLIIVMWILIMILTRGGGGGRRLRGGVWTGGSGWGGGFGGGFGGGGGWSGGGGGFSGGGSSSSW